MTAVSARQCPTAESGSVALCVGTQIGARMDRLLVQERDDSTVTVRLGGDLDELACEDIEPMIQTAALLWLRVVVDLTDVAFCTSAGLGMFIRCEQSASEHGG